MRTQIFVRRLKRLASRRQGALIPRMIDLYSPLRRSARQKDIPDHTHIFVELRSGHISQTWLSRNYSAIKSELAFI